MPTTIKTWQQWARFNARDSTSPSLLGPNSLAALTGTDVRCLSVFVAAVELFAHTSAGDALAAMAAAVRLMQPETRWIAKELIPFVLDWNDRDRVWDLMQLPRSFAPSPSFTASPTSPKKPNQEPSK